MGSSQLIARSPDVMTAEVHKLTTEKAIRIDCHITYRAFQGVAIGPGAMLDLMDPEAAKAYGLRVLGPVVLWCSWLMVDDDLCLAKRKLESMWLVLQTTFWSI